MTNNLGHRLQKSLRFIVYSNLWISLSVGIWTYAHLRLFHSSNAEELGFFAGLATLFIYNFQRFIKFDDRTNLDAGRNNWLYRNKSIVLLLSIIGAVGSLAFLKFLSSKDFLVLIIAGIPTALYVLPKSFRRFSLRDLPYAKIHVIAFSWVSICILLPATHVSFPFDSPDIYLILLEKYLFILAITIPFDIRDLKFDEASKRTIPQILGINKAVNLAMLLILASTILAFIIYELGSYKLSEFIALYFSYLLCIYVLRKSKVPRSELFYAGILDALPLIQGLALLAFIN